MTEGKLLHGGDYNPEQWLDRPDILEEDIRLMKEAGVNCVTLGVFSWSVLEPEEGVYDLEWLGERIEKLYENGIRVILATPSGAMPHWLTQKYPEVMQVQEDEKRNLPGRRHNFCYTSPVMREKIRRMDLELSKRFGKHPAMILWHVSNELGGNWGDGACHCEACQRAFRQWLRARYHTLDKLNHAWWNRFWSHMYTDWEQIHSPAPHGECLSHGLKLDWKRFVTDQMTDFCRSEIKALREHSALPVTTNFMDFFKNLDYRRLQDCLDVISWDNYPHWHGCRDEVPAAVRAAAGHSMMRSMKRQPFLLMESTPSCVNWREFNPVKRPGMHMLSSMQAIAHGSDSVQYFQWRKGRGAYEKFHGAVVGHKGAGQTRTFREVSEVGRRLASIQESVAGSVNAPRAAIVFDWENWWAVEDSAGPRQDMDYVAEVLKHYQIFWENGVDVDFIGMGEALDGYRAVCAPMNYLYRDGYADRVRRYVEEGGCYVTTYFSGTVDDTDLCFTDRHPLEDVLGIIQEEIDAPGEGFENGFVYRGTRFSTGRVCEICHAMEGTETLAVYDSDFYAGCPAVTRNRYGRGSCYYIAAETGQDFLRAFYGELFRETDMNLPFGGPLPYGVTAAVRRGRQDLVFVMNFRQEAVCLCGIGSWEDVETGAVYKDRMELEGFSCKIVQRRQTTDTGCR